MPATKVRILMIAEVTANSEAEAQARLDAFREAVRPEQMYGITLLRSGPANTLLSDDDGLQTKGFDIIEDDHELTPAELNRLRMLADWQVRQEGYDPAEITRLCQEQDEAEGRNGNRHTKATTTQVNVCGEMCEVTSVCGGYARGKDGLCAYCDGDPCAERSAPETRIYRYMKDENGKYRPGADTCPCCEGRPS